MAAGLKRGHTHSSLGLIPPPQDSPDSITHALALLLPNLIEEASINLQSSGLLQNTGTVNGCWSVRLEITTTRNGNFSGNFYMKKLVFHDRQFKCALKRVDENLPVRDLFNKIAIAIAIAIATATLYMLRTIFDAMAIYLIAGMKELKEKNQRSKGSKQANLPWCTDTGESVRRRRLVKLPLKAEIYSAIRWLHY